VNQDGSVSVRETYEIDFVGGDFTFGYRKIPISNYVSIENVSVNGDGQAYVESSGNGANTFEWGKDGSDYVIDWYYNPTRDSTHVFVVGYVVRGGLYIDQAAGDGIAWKAVGPDHDYDVGSSTVSVTVPPGAFLNSKTAPYFAGAEASYLFSSDLRSVTFQAAQIPAGQDFEVGVRFPHGYVPDQKQAWQTIQEQKPVLNTIVGALGLFLLVGGLVGVYLLWAFAGKDPSVGVVPSYLSEPPSGLPPGLVGTLVDEKADLQDIIATLVDLAKRGAIDMEERKKTAFGLIASSEFVFHRRIDFTGQVLKYETLLISEMFGAADEVALSDLKNRFYSSVPRLQSALYDEAVKEGLFPTSPKAVRSWYIAFGVVGLVLAVGASFCAASLWGAVVDTLLCPFAALGLVSLSLMVISGAMPTKTRKGAEESIKWNAFKEYLQRIEKYVDLKSATDQFDRFLPFAIAFGLERTWIGKFARIDTAPVPGWYYPVGLPYGRGLGRSGAGIGGSFVQGGAAGPADLSGRAVGAAPSLDGLSGRMMTGLSGVSNGLFSMLNSTANVFTSVPHSSGSGGGWSGGGGFSGGGFSGGGGGAGFG
jgi:hypothetical protein